MATLKELLESTQEKAYLLTPVGELSDEDLESAASALDDGTGLDGLEDPSVL